MSFSAQVEFFLSTFADAQHIIPTNVTFLCLNLLIQFNKRLQHDKRNISIPTNVTFLDLLIQFNKRFAAPEFAGNHSGRVYSIHV